MPKIPHGVEISDGVLYRASINIPSQVPVGTYTAETFLIDRGKVIAAATRDIEIGKSGFERFVALAARRHRFLYGLVAVLLSLAWAGPPPRSSAAASRRAPKLNLTASPIPGRFDDLEAACMDDQPNLQQFVNEVELHGEEARAPAPTKQRRARSRASAHVVEIAGSGSRCAWTPPC